jgi:hypothetical protein
VKKGAFTVACLLLLGLAPAAHAGGPSLVLGATEDDVRQPTPAAAKAQMDLLRVAGFRAIRVTQVWRPGESAPTQDELAPLANAVEAAKTDGIDVTLTVTQFGSKTTPLTDQDQSDFAAFAASLARQLPTVRSFVVSNEPNLNRYWLPQYGADGSDVAAPAYETLLARTYDALKAVDPTIEVLGGALAPRGSDRAGTIRDTHSPTAFIRDLGAAYRASGRTLPIMDALTIHPYEDNSSVPPVEGTHPDNTSIAIADYAKLVGLLREAFDGTAQPGASLPLVYDEFGVEAQIPDAKASLYTGTEPSTIHPVDEQTQAEYYRQALALAFCQPTVQGFYVFHTVDEQARAGWQSGLYYVDGTPKASLAPTRAALAEVRRGVIAQCPGLHLRPKAVFGGAGLRPVLRCDLDCSYVARLVRLPGKTVGVARGVAVGEVPRTVRFSRAGLRPGRYRVRVELRAKVNPGPKWLTAHGETFVVS